MTQHSEAEKQTLVLRPVIVVPLLDGSKAQEWLKQQMLQDPYYKVVTTKTDIYFPITDFSKVDSLWPIQRKLVPPRSKAVSYIDILKTVLPEELHSHIPHGFDQIGSILLIKLNYALNSYKSEIGNVLLQKFAMKSVFNKQADVSSRFRISQWELLAGDPYPVTVYRMYGLRLKIHINKVYFNPRLGAEYVYIASLTKTGEVIIDMFAGVGPFSLMCAKQQKLMVFACDINPHAIALFQENINLNKKFMQGRIVAKIGDIRKIISSFPKANRILMNLPVTAIDYLDIAVQYLQKGGIIHLHQFHRLPKEQPELYLQEQQNNLVTKLNLLSKKYTLRFTKWTIKSRIIREVSPSKSHIVWDIDS